jgi:hypothetical protein
LSAQVGNSSPMTQDREVAENPFAPLTTMPELIVGPGALES